MAQMEKGIIYYFILLRNIIRDIRKKNIRASFIIIKN